MHADHILLIIDDSFVATYYLQPIAKVNSVVDISFAL